MKKVLAFIIGVFSSLIALAGISLLFYSEFDFITSVIMIMIVVSGAIARTTLRYAFRARRRERYVYSSFSNTKKTRQERSEIDKALAQSTLRKITKLSLRKEIREDFIKFLSKYYRDFLHEIRDGKLDWNNENTKMFFRLMNQKYKLSDSKILAVTFLIKDQIEYRNYIDSISAGNLETSDEVIKESVLYDIYNQTSFNGIYIQKACKELIGKKISVNRISRNYKRTTEELKLTKFEQNLENSERVGGSLEKQLRADQHKAVIGKLIEADLDPDPENYIIVQADFKRNNTIDNHYKRHFSYSLSRAFQGLCCKCGQGMGTLEYDHFWLPKSKGGNFIMRQESKGLYINNCIPLCRSCNSSKGAKSFTEYFSPDEIKVIATRSQSINGEINERMIDFYDEGFKGRSY